MSHLTQQTQPVREKDIVRQWHLIDAKGQVLGRLATRIAGLLIGKHKTQTVGYLDVGDSIVVINAQQVKVTGNKAEQKIYTSYSGYPGGLKEMSFARLQAKKPQDIVKKAVWGMLPKNKLRQPRMRRLFIYRDEKHPYEEKVKS